MRAALVLALAVSTLPLSSAVNADPAELWQPMHWTLGTWKGVKAGTDAPIKVKRTFASASTNHHIEISESGNGRSRVMWGMVSVDPARGQLVMRHFAADGTVSELAFDEAGSADGRLVFASPEAVGTRTRITFERAGPRAFVERVERATGGGSFAPVSETRFERTDW